MQLFEGGAAAAEEEEGQEEGQEDCLQQVKQAGNFQLNFFARTQTTPATAAIEMAETTMSLDCWCWWSIKMLGLG